MDVMELVQKYGKGQGEAKMWASVAVLSEALEPMKETDKVGNDITFGIWEIVKRQMRL